MSNSNLARAEAATRKSLITVHHYDVRVDVSNAQDLADPGFSTQSTITFDAATAGAATFLDFIGLGVESVVLNGVELDVGQVVDDARIMLDGLALENHVVVTATAAYSRSGEGLHRFQDPADGQVYTYTQYEPADARRVFANFEQPDLKAPFTFHVTAPAGWEVASNQSVTAYADLATNAAGNSAAGNSAAGCWDFAPTLPISTYITTILAGPYFKVSDQFTMTFGPDSAHAGTQLDIPLTAYCRASLAEHFDSDPIFAVTKAGLSYFNELFDYPYPFGKYDQAFVPEYNLGAMENPGLVTFTEGYIHSSRATDTQYQQRANTIMHEMAHMWFGDLVTMSWWDDLWLKESFADFMGHLAVAEATAWGEKSWTLFASRRKTWAYVQDQLPTTHPIVADIPNLEAAKQNFDGITYAKGASVLKQLVAYVGQDAFIAGARAYFRTHEYSNTTLADLLGPLSEASGRDLGSWASLWLQTAGISTLTPSVQTVDGKITAFTITQDAVDPITNLGALRPHRLSVGLFNHDGGALVRTHAVTVDVVGDQTVVAELAGLPAPAMVVVNDQDLTYAKVRLDDVSLATALSSLRMVADPLARSLVWSSLWNAVRDAAIPAPLYVQAVCDHAAGEADIALLQTLADNARFAVSQYCPPESRGDIRAGLLAAVERNLDAAAPGSDEQLVWARTFASLGRSSDAPATRIRGLLNGRDVPAELRVDSSLRWLLWQALAARGLATVAELDKELAAATTAETRVGRHTAGAAFPDAAVKARAWEETVEGTELTNELLSATIEGFMVGSQELLDPYVEPYFEVLTSIWQDRSIEIAGRIVRGLFPAHQALPAGTDPVAHPVLVRTDAWLSAHGEAATGLRRLVLEQRDHLFRALTAQAAS